MLKIGNQIEKVFVIISQGASSMTNFALSFFVLRSLPTNEYGNYSLVVAIGLFIISIQNSLVNTPLMIEKGNFSDDILNVFFNYGIRLSFILILPVYFLLYILDVNGSIFLVTTYFPLLLVRELCRMAIIWKSDMRMMVYLECFLMISTIGFLSFIYFIDIVTILNVYIAAALSMLICVGFIIKKYSLHRGTDQLFDYSSILTNVKWSLKGVIVTELNSRGYVYIISFFFGKEALALLNAPRLIVSPINSIGYAFAKFSKPKLAQKINQGEIGGAFAILSEYRMFSFIIAISISAICYIFWETIYNLFFIKFDKTSISYITIFWFVMLFFQITNMYNSSFLQSYKKFKGLFWVTSLSALLSSVLLFFLIFFDMNENYILFSILFSELCVFCGLLQLRKRAILT